MCMNVYINSFAYFITFSKSPILISSSNAHTMPSYIEDYILFLCAVETHELWSLRCTHNNNSL